MGAKTRSRRVDPPMNAQLPATRPAPSQKPATHPQTGGSRAGIPAQGAEMHATAPNGRRITALTGRQKAAILVQLLLVEGADLNLAALPEDMQAELTEQMASMRLVDRDTLMAVVAEFVETLEQVGLSFPDGLDSALKALGPKLSPGAAGKLRRIAQATGHGNPWDRIVGAEVDVLAELLSAESIEVSAVVLSKLPVAKAAELLGKFPGERARRVAYAVAQTEGILPEVVQRIGAALAGELDNKPPPAFPVAPAARVGAILNSAPPDLRDTLLEGLDADNAAFAEGVRRSIFTFGHIAERVEPLDLTKIIREVEQQTLINALAHALPQNGTPVAASAEFILANLSQRMAASLRDEIEGIGRLRPKDGEAAMAEVVAAIRGLADREEIMLRDPDEA